MLAKRIIACLDVRNGRVVKGTKFTDIKDVDSPEKLAKFYSDNSVDELVFYDITASNEERKTSLEFVERVAKVINIPFSAGGGVSTIEDFKYILRKGADKVSVNSAAVRNPQLIREASMAFGSQCVVLSMDVKKNDEGSWSVYVKGGREKTELDAIDWAVTAAELGAGEIVVNSIDEDGMKNGYDLELLSRITSVVNIPVIASGGAGKKEHFLDALQKTGVDGVLAASVFHFGEIKVPELKHYLKENGAEIRMPEAAPQKKESPSAENADISMISFGKDGLVPCICQDAKTGAVLMLAYMNEQSLRLTLEKKRAVYYSRSRSELWEKGATSGNTQKVRAIYYDCDADALLIKVDQTGNACHTGAYSCFFNAVFDDQEASAAQLAESGASAAPGSAAEPGSSALSASGVSADPGSSVFGELYATVIDRKNDSSEGSYTNYLFDKGLDKILKKVGEEAAETIIAAKNQDRQELIGETGDLIYHLTVMLAEKGISMDEIEQELKSRFR